MEQLIAAWVVVIIVAREFLVTGIRLVATSQGASARRGQSRQAQDRVSNLNGRSIS